MWFQFLTCIAFLSRISCATRGGRTSTENIVTSNNEIQNITNPNETHVPTTFTTVSINTASNSIPVSNLSSENNTSVMRELTTQAPEGTAMISRSTLSPDDDVIGHQDIHLSKMQIFLQVLEFLVKMTPSAFYIGVYVVHALIHRIFEHI